MASNSENTILIAYNETASASFVQQLTTYLSDKEINVTSTATLEGNEALLQAADSVVFVITPAFILSTQGPAFIEQALQADKRLVPIVHVAPPEEMEVKEQQEGKEVVHILSEEEIWSRLNSEINKISRVDFTKADTFEKAAETLCIRLRKTQETGVERTIILEDDEESTTTASTQQLEGTKKPLKTHIKDVFISYGRRESLSFASKLYQQLSKENIDAWFDFVNIPKGDDFQQRIDNGIESAHNFIFIISPHAIMSPYCLKEVELAVRLKKRIIPIIHVEPYKSVEVTKVVDGQKIKETLSKDDIWNMLHPAIGERNWVLCKEKPDDDKPREEWEPIDDFEKGFEDLLALIRKDADYVQNHTRFLAKALEWESHQKASEYLLTGRDREEALKWMLTEFHPPEQPPCEPTDLHCEYICESRKNAENLLTDVFVSYAAEKDLPEGEQSRILSLRHNITKALARHGITTWLHDQDIQKGLGSFETAIYKGVEQADLVLFFISKESVKSKWCLLELEHAIKYNKRIIPLLIEEVPEAERPEAIQKLQYINFTDNDEARVLKTKRDKSDFEKDIDELVREIRLDQHYFRQAKTLLVHALKWKESGENDSLILRGYELKNAEDFIETGAMKAIPPTDLHKEFVEISRRKNAESEMHTDVFISYSNSDSDFARRLNTALQLKGKNTWFDQENIAPGIENPQEEIDAGIEEAENFVFIITQKSVQSEDCIREITYAAKNGKRIITLQLQEVESKKELPEVLRRLKKIDFQNQPFDQGLAQLIRTTEEDVEYVRFHTKLTQKALDWKKIGYPKDLLLPPLEYQNAKTWFEQAQENTKQPEPTEIQANYIKASFQGIRKAKQRFVLSAVGVGVLLFITGLFVYYNTQKAKELEVQQFILSSLDPLVSADSAVKYAYNGYLRTNPKTPYVIRNVFRALEEYEEKRENSLIADEQLNQTTQTPADSSRALSEGTSQSSQSSLFRFLPHEFVGKIKFLPETNLIVTLQNPYLSEDERKELAPAAKQYYFEEVDYDPTYFGAFDSYIDQYFDKHQGEVPLKLWDGTTGKIINEIHLSNVRSYLGFDDTETIKITDAHFGLEFGNGIIDLLLETNSSKYPYLLWRYDDNYLDTIIYNLEVTKAAISPSKKYFVDQDKSDNLTYVWQIVPDVKQVLSLSENITQLVFSPQDDYIAYVDLEQGGESTVQLYNIAENVVVALSHSNKVEYVEFSYDAENRLLLTADSSQITIWNMQGEKIKSFEYKKDVSIQYDEELYAKTKNAYQGNVLFPARRNIIVEFLDDKASIYSTSGELLNTVSYAKSASGKYISPDGNYFIIAHNDEGMLYPTGHDGSGNSLEPQELEALGNIEDITFSDNSWGFLVSYRKGSNDRLFKIKGEPMVDLYYLGNYRETFSEIRAAHFSPGGQRIRGITRFGVMLWTPEQQLRYTLESQDAEFISILPDHPPISHLFYIVVAILLITTLYVYRIAMQMKYFMAITAFKEIGIYGALYIAATVILFIIFSVNNGDELIQFSLLLYFAVLIACLALYDAYKDTWQQKPALRFGYAALSLAIIPAVLYLAKDVLILDLFEPNLRDIDQRPSKDYILNEIALAFVLGGILTLFLFLPPFIGFRLVRKNQPNKAYFYISLFTHSLAVMIGFFAMQDHNIPALLLGAGIILLHRVVVQTLAWIEQKRYLQLGVYIVLYAIIGWFYYVATRGEIDVFAGGIALFYGLVAMFAYLKDTLSKTFGKRMYSLVLLLMVLVLVTFIISGLSNEDETSFIWAVLLAIPHAFLFIPLHIAFQHYYAERLKPFFYFVFAPIYLLVFFFPTLLCSIPLHLVYSRRFSTKSGTSRWVPWGILTVLNIGTVLTAWFLLFLPINQGVGLLIYLLYFLIDAFILLFRRKWLPDYIRESIQMGLQYLSLRRKKQLGIAKPILEVEVKEEPELVA